MPKVSTDISQTTCQQVAALPWRRDGDSKVRIPLITSRTNVRWMLPKGWPMDGKTAAEAALVEAKEKAGIDGIVSEKPIGSYRNIKIFDNGGSLPAQPVVYPILVSLELADWDKRDQRTRRWVRPKKAVKLAFEPDLKWFLIELRDEALVLLSSAA